MAHGPFEPLPRSKMIWTFGPAWSIILPMCEPWPMVYQRGVRGHFGWSWSVYINRPGILYRSHPNKMFYIPLGLKFQGESESGGIVPIHSLYKAVTDTPVIWPYFRNFVYHPHQNFKGFWIFYYKLDIWLVASSIVVFDNFQKYNLYQSRWVIYHHDQIFKKILNLLSEFLNSACKTYYRHICLSATFQRNQTFTNQDGLYITLTGFSWRFWIWSQYVHIQPVKCTVSVFLLDLYLHTW